MYRKEGRPKEEEIGCSTYGCRWHRYTRFGARDYFNKEAVRAFGNVRVVVQICLRSHITAEESDAQAVFPELIAQLIANGYHLTPFNGYMSTYHLPPFAFVALKAALPQFIDRKA